MENLGSMLRQRRRKTPMTLRELAAASGVSSTHLSRIEIGKRTPSARVLVKIAKPLGFSETELLALAGYPVEPQPLDADQPVPGLDPFAAGVLAQEPVEIQRTVVNILVILKRVAEIQKGKKHC